MNIIKVTVPDMGNIDTVSVIEVSVKAGDTVKKEQALITLESDKASMEVPSPAQGVVQAVNVKVGDKIKQDDLILSLELATRPLLRLLKLKSLNLHLHLHLRLNTKLKKSVYLILATLIKSMSSKYLFKLG